MYCPFANSPSGCSMNICDLYREVEMLKRHSAERDADILILCEELSALLDALEFLKIRCDELAAAINMKSAVNFK